jgi:hypothetical protein
LILGVHYTFETNISVTCAGTGDIPTRKVTNIYAVNGACPAVKTGLPVLWSGSSEINNSTQVITLTGVKSTIAYSNIKLMIETDANELRCSSDSFSIRPSSYWLTSPTGSINTSPFTLQLSATNAGGGYNGSGSLRTTLKTANTACKKSSKFLTSSSEASEPFTANFVGDANNSSVKTTDIGTIYLNVKDTSWTAVDQSGDCIPNSNATAENVQGLVGCNIDNNLTLTIVPNHFDVNATLFNANGGTFTYLSTDLNMSARIDLNISAKNSEGVTAENYSTGCYAYPSTLTLPHSVIPIPLTTINSLESTTSTITSTPVANAISIPFNASIFKDGKSNLSVKLNFDRSFSKPVSPFDFNVTNTSITDSTGITGAFVPTKKATFVYGRARSYDIKADQSPVPNPVELEVYSTTATGYVNGMPQNVLHWYRNLNHDETAQGRVLNGGFSAGTMDANIDTSSIPLDGLQNVYITSSVSKTVHLNINSWLWNSSTNNYNYNGDCTKHLCFDYQFSTPPTNPIGQISPANNINGVNSGVFQGADFTITPAKSIVKRGVKVFR